MEKQEKQAEDDLVMRDPRSNPKVRFRDMDKMGVDIQVVSMNMPASCYGVEGKAGQTVARNRLNAGF